VEFLAPRPTPDLDVYTYSGSYPLACLAWVTLPRLYAPASVVPGVVRACKAPHPQHVLRQGGSPWGGHLIIRVIKSEAWDGWNM